MPGSYTPSTLFCKVGDLVEFALDIDAANFDGREGSVSRGDIYEAACLVGSGWDLKKLSGSGPEWLRLLNSEMPRYVRKLET